MSNLRDTTLALEPIFAAVNKRILRLEESDQAKNKHIEDLETKNKEMEMKLLGFEKLLAPVKAENFRIHISDLQTKQNSLNEAVETINQKLKQFCAEINRLTNLQRLLNQLHTRVSDRQELSDKISALQDRHNKLAKSVKGMERSTEKELASTNKMISDLQNKHRTLTADMDGIDRHNREEIASINRVISGLQDKHSTLSDFVKGIDSSSNQKVASINMQISNLQAKQSNATELIEAVLGSSHHEVASLNKVNDKLKKDLQELKDKIDVRNKGNIVSKRNMAFSAGRRLDPPLQLKDKDVWFKLELLSDINQVESPNLNQKNSLFTATVAGVYAFSLTVVHSGKGELAGGLLIGDKLGYYFGRTSAEDAQSFGLGLLCLKKGETVSGAAIRYSGEAKVSGFCLSGWLIEER